MKTWKRLWFVLKGGELLYYKGPVSKILLGGGMGVMVVNRCHHKHILIVLTYLLCC